MKTCSVPCLEGVWRWQYKIYKIQVKVIIFFNGAQNSTVQHRGKSKKSTFTLYYKVDKISLMSTQSPILYWNMITRKSKRFDGRTLASVSPSFSVFASMWNNWFSFFFFRAILVKMINIWLRMLLIQGRQWFVLRLTARMSQVWFMQENYAVICGKFHGKGNGSYTLNPRLLLPCFSWSLHICTRKNQ